MSIAVSMEWPLQYGSCDELSCHIRAKTNQDRFTILRDSVEVEDPFNSIYKKIKFLSNSFH